jgi:hypothetical protein
LLQKDLRGGKVTGESWECPKCGGGWCCEVDGEIRSWTPDEVLELIRLPR